MTPPLKRRVCLVILDGVGYRTETSHNAVAAAQTPFLDRAYNEFPWVLLEPGGEAVGLPAGQMGNSEVGHLNLGAGRVIYQELTRIDKAIAIGELASNPGLGDFLASIAADGGALHLIGLCSDGGVHASLEHLLALLTLLPKLFRGAVYLHVLTDGRDTNPTSGAGFVTRLEAALAGQDRVRIADVGGRYYAMDRDKRWDRVEKAYRVLVDGGAERVASNATAAVQMAYSKGATDEFILPTRLDWAGRGPLEGCIQPGDGVLCFNFRADRMRQLVRTLIDPAFTEFARPHFGSLHVATMTQYDATFPVTVLFPPQDASGGLVSYLSDLGFGIFKIAETEKYAHVTYFFNGGVEEPYPGEERVLIPSPKVATYDLQPAMSAPEVTDLLARRILEHTDALLVCNYANGDMVGHTGNFEAAVAAMTVIDQSLLTLYQACQERGVLLCITADHGNCEEMQLEGDISTQHSLRPVPFIVCDPAIHLQQIVAPGALAQVSPTVLDFMGLPIPPQMTAPSLAAQPASVAAG